MQIKGILKSDLMQAGMPLSLDEVAGVSGETPAAASSLVNELVWQSEIYRERERNRERGRKRES